MTRILETAVQTYKLQIDNPKENGCAGWHTRLVLYGNLGIKKRPKAPKMQKYLLTDGNRNDKMILHTVVVCPFMASGPNMNILSQDVGSVK